MFFKGIKGVARDLDSEIEPYALLSGALTLNPEQQGI
jgi:hypothetical protein